MRLQMYLEHHHFRELRGHEHERSCRIMAKGKYTSPHCGLDVTSYPKWLKCHYSGPHASGG